MTTIQPKQVLIYNRQPVGVRSFINNQGVDVDIDSLKPYLTPNDLKVLQPAQMIEHGDLIMTQEEIQNNLDIKDVSDNKKIVKAIAEAIKALAQPKQSVQPKAKAPQAKATKPNKPTSKGGNRFNVHIIEEGLGSTCPPSGLTGEFTAKNALVARKKAKEYYAQELGTEPKYIKILKCELVE